MNSLLSEATLRRLRDSSRIVVAVSGGVDSVALLHAVQCAELEVPIQALHVNHGLVQNAEAMVASASEVCELLSVPLTVIDVDVTERGSVEAAAREARYQAFAEYLDSGDLLLLAHHADDQVETVLFRLFRGSRVPGLQGMPAQRPVGKAELFRPLLAISKAEICAYAENHGLNWVEDDSNQDQSFDRNYIRHSVLPVIEQRWPGVRLRLLSALQRDTEIRSKLLLDQNDQLSLMSLERDCLDLNLLRELSQAELVDLLNAWLAELSVPLPTGKFLAEVAGNITAHQMIDVRSGDLEIRQHRDQLFALRVLPSEQSETLVLDQRKLALSGGHITNELSKGHGLRQANYQVRFRQGGETLRQRHDRSLKNLCQEGGLPTWLRPRLPLVFLGDELVALAAVPAWGFAMQIADGHMASEAESGLKIALHLDDRW